MEHKKIEFLEPKDHKILNVIEVIGPAWNSFRGYIPYSRNLDLVKYDYEKGDLLDQGILSTIKAQFPESRLIVSERVIFKNQLEDRLKNIQGGAQLGFTIQIYPLLPFEDNEDLKYRTYKAYPVPFNMRLFLDPNSEKLKHINNYLICPFDYLKLDEHIKTLIPL